MKFKGIISLALILIIFSQFFSPLALAANTTDNNKIKVSITGTLHYDTSVKEINHYRINKTNYSAFTIDTWLRAMAIVQARKLSLTYGYEIKQGRVRTGSTKYAGNKVINYVEFISNKQISPYDEEVERYLKKYEMKSIGSASYWTESGYFEVLILGDAVSNKGSDLSYSMITQTETIEVEKDKIILNAINSDYNLYYSQTKATKIEIYQGDSNVRFAGDVFKYRTSNRNVATVDANGVIKPVGVGDCQITASLNTKNVVINVHVKPDNVRKPTLKKDIYYYTGEEQKIELNNFDERKMNISNNVQKDVGNYQTVVSLKDKNNQKWLDSTNDDLVFNWSITKYDCTEEVKKPELIKITNNSIELVRITGYEYSLDGINFQDSNIFNGLKPETKYTIYQRIKERENINASKNSEVLNVTTLKNDSDMDAPNIDLSTLKVSNTNVTSGNTTAISLKATDKSDIKDIYINYMKPMTGVVSDNLNLTYNNEKDLYETTLKIDSDYESGDWKIYSIFASDSCGNYITIYNTEFKNNIGKDLSSGNFNVYGTHFQLYPSLDEISEIELENGLVIYKDDQYKIKDSKKTTKYTSNNNYVISIDETGLMTAQNVGTAVITETTATGYRKYNVKVVSNIVKLEELQNFATHKLIVQEDGVQKRVAWDSNEDGELTIQELRKAKYYADWTKRNTINDFKYTPNLEHLLYLSTNENIKDFTVINTMKRLKSLWIQDISINSIKDLKWDFSDFYNLYSFVFKSNTLNDLEDIDKILNNKNLLQLELGKNIKNIDALSKIKNFKCKTVEINLDNSVNDISPLKNINAETLSIHGGTISDLSFIDNSTIVNLNINDNVLKLNIKDDIEVNKKYKVDLPPIFTQSFENGKINESDKCFMYDDTDEITYDEIEKAIYISPTKVGQGSVELASAYANLIVSYNAIKVETVEKTDNSSGIKIKTTDNIVPSTISLNVEKVDLSNETNKELKEIIDALPNKTENTKYQTFNIKLVDDKEQEIQPNGDVTVYLPIPDDYSSKINIYNINSTNIENPYTVLDTTIETIDKQKYAKFTTNHFGYYSIVNEGLIGDINGDGKINIKDWNILYAYINETMTLSSEELQRADVNEDGKINVKDLNRLYEHITETNPLD